MPPNPQTPIPPSTAARVGRPPRPPRPRRAYHVHLPLLLYCGVSLLIAIGAFNSNNNLLFWLFALALSMLIVSGVLSGQMLMGLNLERDRAEPVSAGEPLRLRYRVSNRNRFFPAFALSLAEEPRVANPAGADILSGPPPGGFIPHVGAGKTVIAGAVCATAQRGVAHLETVRITTEFPFGIVRKSLVFTSPLTVVVRPAEAPVSRTLLDGARAQSVRSEHAGHMHVAGHGDHFLALREYSAGDNPRLIAWRASSRLDPQAGGAELLVRQYAAAPSGTVYIVLDALCATDEAGYEKAISQAAALLTQAARKAGGAERVRTGFFALAGGGWLHTEPTDSGGRILAVLDTLATLPRFADRPGPPPTVQWPSMRSAAIVLVDGVAPPSIVREGDLAARAVVPHAPAI